MSPPGSVLVPIIAVLETRNVNKRKSISLVCVRVQFSSSNGLRLLIGCWNNQRGICKLIAAGGLIFDQLLRRIGAISGVLYRLHRHSLSQSTVFIMKFCDFLQR